MKLNIFKKKTDKKPKDEKIQEYLSSINLAELRCGCSKTPTLASSLKDSKETK